MLGMHAALRTSGNDSGVLRSRIDEQARRDVFSVPLSWVHEPRRLHCEQSEKYGLKWVARLAVLTVLLGEAVMSFVLWIRRLSYWKLDMSRPSSPPGLDITTRADSMLDVFNAPAGLGAAVTALISIMILVLNCEWAGLRSDLQQAAANQARSGRRHWISSPITYISAVGLWIMMRYQDIELLAPAAADLTSFLPHGVLFNVAVGVCMAVVFLLVLMEILFFVALILILPFPSDVLLPSAAILTKLDSKWSECICLSLSMELRILLVGPIIMEYRQMFGCLSTTEPICGTPYLLWADPWSNRFLTL